MVPMLSECWRFVQYLFRPEDLRDGAHHQLPPLVGRLSCAVAGVVKTLFWACLAVLAGLGLGQLSG
ncbi:MAG: hypothetical protein Q7I92_01890 [Humidesulfovibrio sp.]|nr:hypothetical protein [Humidesulfovibrio sp.]